MEPQSFNDTTIHSTHIFVNIIFAGNYTKGARQTIEDQAMKKYSVYCVLDTCTISDLMITHTQKYFQTL